MVTYIEFPIFDGVSVDLRHWISWLEDFFVREKFTALEKMNMAQSLLEGEAEAWFYSSRKRFRFRSWEHLIDHMIWRFGDFSDPELFLLFDKNDRLLQKQIDAAKLRRMSRTAITPQESISSPATIHETVPVAKFSTQQVDEISVEKKDESHEATSIPENVTIWDTEPEALIPTDTILVMKKAESSSATDASITQTQVPVSSLEPGLSFSSEIINSGTWPSEMVSHNRVHSQPGFECVKNKNYAHHVFDEWSHRRHQVLHDPGGKKDDHSDDIFDTEVDIDNVQRPQEVTVAESVITTPYNVAESVVTAPAIVAVSAYVTAFAELSTQVIALEDSHLEQIFNEELKTELQEVLKLKESMGLENQKKSRCLKASRFNFKRKKKRIKRWFNTLSCRESWRKHKHENLQLVSGLVGFNVGDFRCHKEYGLARLGNWSQVRVEYSLLQGELFCKNTLPRKPATSSMLPLYVYQMGVSDIQDNAKEMVADPVSLQLILDVNKTSKTLDNQRFFTPTPVASVNSLSFAVDNFELCVGHDKDIMRLKLLLHSGCDGEKLTELGFQVVNSWCGWMVFDRGKTHMISGGVITRVFLDLKQFLCENVHRVSCLSLDAQFHSLEFQLKHKWRSKHLHTISAWEFYLSSIFPTVTSANSCCGYKRMHEQLQAVFGPQNNPSDALDVVTTAAIFQLVPERSVSHDCFLGSLWEKKIASLLEVVCVLPECMLHKSFALWHRWRRKASICVLPLQFSFFKLEDKLVFGEGSIDTLHQAYHRKNKKKIAVASGVVAKHLDTKKLWVETEGFKYKEASD